MGFYIHFDTGGDDRPAFFGSKHGKFYGFYSYVSVNGDSIVQAYIGPFFFQFCRRKGKR